MGLRVSLCLVVAAFVATAFYRTASSDIGVSTRIPTGYSWADNQGTGPQVIARYASFPVLTGTGNGTMNWPTVPELYDYGTMAATVPLETITATAVDATTFDVAGSVSGAHPQATVGVAYTTNHGVTFTITAGGTAFVAGDAFTFAITDSVSASDAPTHQSYPVTGKTVVSLGSVTPVIEWFNPTVMGSSRSGISISTTGYINATDSNPEAGKDYRIPASMNQQLPSGYASAGEFR